MTWLDSDGGFWAADRGVSETVGFVLVFALITSTIAVTFTVGLGGLEDAQLAERDNNVERAFDVLHDNLNDISRNGVPSRATEIRLGGGRLAFATDSNIQIYDQTNGPNESLAVSSTAIVYHGTGDTEIRYEHGAVIRSDGGGSVMLREPDIMFGETALIGLVAIGQGATESVGGDRTVLVRTDRGGRTATEVNENVTIQVRGSTADAWERYFRDLQNGDGAGRITDINDAQDDLLKVNVTAAPNEPIVVHRTLVGTKLTD
ncbi:hypothetical protein ABNG03_07985 [Halorubrum sp. RMP-47]|uniref:Flagellin n=1 Tax=Halorubrum miltondacostae TaxID=3076378 RepID=A0ABD5M3C9_9EURY